MPTARPAAVSLSDCQPFLQIQSLGLLPVDHDLLPPQQNMKAAIAEPPSLVGGLVQLFAERSLIASRETVALTLTIGINNTHARQSLIP